MNYQLAVDLHNSGILASRQHAVNILLDWNTMLGIVGSRARSQFGISRLCCCREWEAFFIQRVFIYHKTISALSLCYGECKRYSLIKSGMSAYFRLKNLKIFVMQDKVNQNIKLFL